MVQQPEPARQNANPLDPLSKRQRTSGTSSPPYMSTSADSGFSGSSTAGSIGYSPPGDSGFQDFLDMPMPQFTAADPLSMDMDEFLFLYGNDSGLTTPPDSTMGGMDGSGPFDPFSFACEGYHNPPFAQTSLPAAIDSTVVPTSNDSYGFLTTEMFGDIETWTEPVGPDSFLPAVDNFTHGELDNMPVLSVARQPSPTPAAKTEPAPITFLRSTPMRPFQPVGSIPPAPNPPASKVQAAASQAQTPPESRPPLRYHSVSAGVEELSSAQQPLECDSPPAELRRQSLPYTSNSSSSPWHGLSAPSSSRGAVLDSHRRSVQQVATLDVPTPLFDAGNWGCSTTSVADLGLHMSAAHHSASAPSPNTLGFCTAPAAPSLLSPTSTESTSSPVYFRSAASTGNSTPTPSAAAAATAAATAFTTNSASISSASVTLRRRVRLSSSSPSSSIGITFSQMQALWAGFMTFSIVLVLLRVGAA
ncbi:hypothetical protein HDU86_008041 [Geranomyces michiganensis]|nr:hypothetical protein HDU86_008041 [Geranomyces michiganensis]